MADPFIAPVQSNAPGLSGIGGVINGQDPNYLYSVMQAQRQKMIADALTQQGMSPIEYDHAGAISPLQGLAKMLQAYSGNKNAATANQTLADAQAVGNQRTMQGLQGLFGGNVTNPTEASTASLTQGAMTQPSTPGADGQLVNQGGVGPTLTNAQRMGQMLSGGTGQQGAAFSVPGMTPQQMTMAYLMDPQGTMKAAFDAKALTPEQKNSRDSLIGAPTVNNLLTQNMTPEQKLSMNLQQLQNQGVPATDPQVIALKGALAKANYIDPIKVGQGDLSMDPVTRLPIAYNPKTPNGIAPMFVTNGGVTTPTGAQALPGYSSANAGIEGAEQRAKQANTVFTGVTGPDNAPQSGFLFGGGAGPAPVVRPAGGNPAAVAPAASGALAVAPRPNGIITGPSATDLAIQKAGADRIAALPVVGQQSRMAITGLESALRTLDNVKATGPGTARTNDVIGSINNATGWNIQGQGNDAYQSLNKLLSNSLNQASQGTGSSGSDARFESFSHGQPNADTMNIKPLAGAIRYVLAQHDASAAGANFMQQQYNQAKAAGDPNAAQTAQTAWSKAYQPDFFAYNRMSPQEHQDYLRSLGEKGAKNFVDQYNAYSKQYGWVK